MKSETHLKTIVNEIEQSKLLRETSLSTYGKTSIDENIFAANAVASGHLDGYKYLSLLAEGIPMGEAWSRSDTFPGQSHVFKEYAQTSTHDGPLNIQSCQLREYATNREVSIQILERLALDTNLIDEYQFRVCSSDNFSSVAEALENLNYFGIERDILTRDNLFWYCTGQIWGGLKLSNTQIIAVYHDPEDLMGKGLTVLDEGAMGYYGLVKAGVTLRDLLLHGGVLIHSPNSQAQA